MDILIKGMEMPSEQYGKMVITLYPNGHVAEYVGDIGRVWEAVPVPPHGRLVDADALEQDAQKRMLICDKNGNQFQKPYEIMRAIALAPTIIEAEEGKT